MFIKEADRVRQDTTEVDGTAQQVAPADDPITDLKVIIANLAEGTYGDESNAKTFNLEKFCGDLSSLV
jgi:hypothetical protein